MDNKIKIAIDAMGGENSPKKIIDGINISLQNKQENFFFLYGQQIKSFSDIIILPITSGSNSTSASTNN